MNLKLIDYQTIAVCLLPLLLITGPALPDIMVTIISITYLVNLILNPKIFYLFEHKKIIRYLLFFYFFIIFSSLLSQNIINSLRFSIPYIRFILFSLLISFLIKNNSKKFYFLFFISCALSLTLLFADTIFQFFNGTNILGFKTIDSANRISSFFHRMILGSYVLKIIPMFLVSILFLVKKKKYNINYFFTFYIASGLIIFLSGDRAPLLLFAILSFGILISLSQFRIKIIYIQIFFILTFLLLIIFNERFHNRYYLRTKNELGLGEKNYVEKITSDINDKKVNKFYKKKFFFFSAIHENYFATAWNIFKDNIYIGSGPKSFSLLSCEKKYQVDKFSCMTHPHNYYMQLLAETGIIGFIFTFIAFIYFIIYFFYFSFFLKQRNYDFYKEPLIILSLGMIIHLWPIVTTGSFFTNYNCILIFFCFGFFLGEKYNLNLFKRIK
jgi:hypothetical protein